MVKDTGKALTDSFKCVGVAEAAAVSNPSLLMEGNWQPVTPTSRDPKTCPDQVLQASETCLSYHQVDICHVKELSIQEAEQPVCLILCQYY